MKAAKRAVRLHQILTHGVRVWLRDYIRDAQNIRLNPISDMQLACIHTSKSTEDKLTLNLRFPRTCVGEIIYLEYILHTNLHHSTSRS